MAYEVTYSDVSVEQLKRLRAVERNAILTQVERVLVVNPTLENKAKIKRLRQPAPTQYRLRVGEFRVFYDVEGEDVQIVQIPSKLETVSYLEEPS